MFFNNILFYLALFIIFILINIIPKRFKVHYLLACSYGFYCAWDYRFLILIIISTLTDYFCGLSIYRAKNQSKKKLILLLSVFINLGILAYFKYFNFFLDNLNQLNSFLGININFELFEIIFPLGISFYTFQTMSYSFDIYFNKYKPTKNLINFSLYVSYFPQLVAGPIERAGKLLPQIEKLKTDVVKIEYQFAFSLIFWGVFKKLAIADNIAVLINEIYTDYHLYDGMTLYLGALLFSLQLYCDFSAYSHIARGVSHLFGINLSVNFKFPIFATNATQFWRTWHITLMDWIRDYFLKYLKTNWSIKSNSLLGIIIIYAVMGFWHGANWNFILFGTYCGLWLYAHIRWRRTNLYKDLNEKNFLYRNLKDISHFFFLPFGFMMFKVESSDFLLYLFSNKFEIYSQTKSLLPQIFGYSLMYLTPLFLIEYRAYKKKDYTYFNSYGVVSLSSLYLFLTIYFIFFGFFDEYKFIYFQF